MRTALSILLTAVLFSFADQVKGQKSTLILGDWVYAEPLDKEEMDAKTQEMMDAFFSTMWFSFKKDGTYACVGMGKEEAGSWTMDAEATLITMTSKDDRKEELRVLDVTADTWLMELSPGKGFKMVHGERKAE